MLCSLITGYQRCSCPFLRVKGYPVLKKLAVSYSEIFIPKHWPTLSFHRQESQNRKIIKKLLHLTVHNSVRYTHSRSNILCTVLANLHTHAPPYCEQFWPLYTNMLQLIVHSSVHYTRLSTLLCTVLSAINTPAPPYSTQFCPLYTKLLHPIVHSSVHYTHSCSTLLCTVLSAIHTAAPPYSAQYCPLYTRLFHHTVHRDVH